MTKIKNLIIVLMILSSVIGTANADIIKISGGTVETVIKTSGSILDQIKTALNMLQLDTHDLSRATEWNQVDKYRKFITTRSGGTAYSTTLDTGVKFGSADEALFYETYIVPHWNTATAKPIDQQFCIGNDLLKYNSATNSFDPLSGQCSSSSPSVTSVPPTSSAPSTPTAKPTIIPPTISRLWDIVSKWFLNLLPFSLQGGETVNTIVNQPYSLQLGLLFTPPDTNYADGSYEAKFGEWFIVDSNKKILYESGWSQELTNSPYAATVTFTPTTPGTYYLAVIIIKQSYTYVNGQWTMTESIETKELQQINANLPGVTKQSPSPLSNIFGSLTSWFNSAFPWLKW